MKRGVGSAYPRADTYVHIRLREKSENEANANQEGYMWLKSSRMAASFALSSASRMCRGSAAKRPSCMLSLR